MTTVMVAGALANRPYNGGGAWVRMSWVRGLQRLGFDVVFVEELRSDVCVDAAGRPTDLDHCVNLAFWRGLVQRFDLTGAAAVVVDGGRRTFGMDAGELTQHASEAALLINLSGHLRQQVLLERVGTKVFVDLDPGFTHYWAAQGADVGLDGHDLHYTVGLNVARSDCPIPTLGLEWRPLPPFVVLDDWPVSAAADPQRLTTVASWRNYGPVAVDGHTFSLKVHQFRRFVDLPARIPQTLEIALAIHPGDDPDRHRLVQHGWRLADPVRVASDPDAFRAYVQGSGGEFSVAQGIYVESRSGWVSDRTVRYLASGLPAIVQDTGTDSGYPLGEGLLTFRTLDEAVAAAQTVAADFDHHRKAARTLAETCFDSDRVLGRLLEDVGVAP